MDTGTRSVNSTSGPDRLGRHAFWIATVLCGALAVVGCGPSVSSLPRNTQTLNGMTIDIGVIPAELVHGHSIEPVDPKALHGGTPKDSSSHHLIVALFDAKTGARITDARIKAGMGNRSYDHEPDTWLEPMQINGTTTYGNFFLLQGDGAWRIHLEILRTGAPRPIEADFVYEHPPD